MLEEDYQQLRDAGLQLRVIHQRDGLFTTTGRALRRAAGRRSGWRWFVIVWTLRKIRGERYTKTYGKPDNKRT